MTVQTDAPRQHDYVGDGSTIAYPYGFLIFAASDLVITQDDVPLTLNTHYTVTGVGEFSGGSVLMIVPPPTAASLKIRSNVAITQGTSFPEGYRFPGRTVEATLDRLTIIARQLKDLILSSVPTFELPTPVANKYVGWNGTGTALVNLDAGPAGPTGLTGLPGAGAAPTITDGTTSVTLPTQVTFPAGSVSSGGAGLAVVAFALPAGIVVPSAASATPTGWLPCDGAAVNRTTYAALFAAIGVAFGAGNGTTTFNVPDLRGRFPLGVGAGVGLTARSLAAIGGEETHLLTTPELASHSHGITDPGHNHGGSGGSTHTHTFPAITASDLPTVPGVFTGLGDAAGNVTTSATAAGGTVATGTTGVTTQTAGGGTAHNNVPPFVVLGFIIKV